MVIYMRHPTHGTKVAAMEAEAIADEKNGWVRFEAGVVLKPDESDVNALAEKRSPGRPRKNTETVI